MILVNIIPNVWSLGWEYTEYMVPWLQTAGSATIAGCEKASGWDQALQLLWHVADAADAGSKGPKPNVQRSQSGGEWDGRWCVMAM